MVPIIIAYLMSCALWMSCIMASEIDTLKNPYTTTPSSEQQVKQVPVAKKGPFNASHKRLDPKRKLPSMHDIFNEPSK